MHPFPGNEHEIYRMGTDSGVGLAVINSSNLFEGAAKKVEI